jgi:hypothetical protein
MRHAEPQPPQCPPPLSAFPLRIALRSASQSPRRTVILRSITCRLFALLVLVDIPLFSKRLENLLERGGALAWIGGLHFEETVISDPPPPAAGSGRGDWAEGKRRRELKTPSKAPRRQRGERGKSSLSEKPGVCLQEEGGLSHVGRVRGVSARCQRWREHL